MPFHQGSRIKNLIEKSQYKISDIIKKSGIAHSSIFDLFKKEEIVRSKLLPILDILKITYEEFMGTSTSTEIEDLKKENATLKNENIQLLKDKIDLMQRIEQLQKSFKKRSVGV
jgi:FtsZ-binding cell division protein ZapB